jgi:hypothetical protein
MNTLLKKVKIRYFLPACLLLALMFTGSVSAAEANQANDQADDFVPAVYTFEGESLAKVLSAAASTMQACKCQNWVTHFEFTKLSFAPPRYRLSIYLGGDIPLAKVPEDWEIVSFRGASLPKVLQEVAKYVTNCACQHSVRDITYERPLLQSDVIAPQHVVSLVLESPPPD